MLLGPHVVWVGGTPRQQNHPLHHASPVRTPPSEIPQNSCALPHLLLRFVAPGAAYTLRALGVWPSPGRPARAGPHPPAGGTPRMERIPIDLDAHAVGLLVCPQCGTRRAVNVPRQCPRVIQFSLE